MSIVDPGDLDSLVESVSRMRSGEEEGWSSLSGDILEQVLALLSFPEVYRLRAVCKGWNALIRERALPSGPLYSPRVLWDGKGSHAVPWFAYDLLETTLRKTTMPQLEFPECARQAYWHLIAAGGGLLCFGAWFGRWRVLVCNPMTKAWRELPNARLNYRASTTRFRRRVMVRHMVVDECRSSYKFLLAGDGAVDLYDSAASKWSAAERLSPELSFQSGAYRNGEMYLLGQMVNSGLYMVKILELGTLRWREDTIPMPTTCVRYPIIVVLSGEVYLVGGSPEVTVTRPMESILLFRLDPGGRWTRVSEYANRAFLKETGSIYACGAHSGRIFVVTLYGTAVFNCATGVWEDPIAEDFFNRNIYGTKFAFQPNLVTAP